MEFRAGSAAAARSKKGFVQIAQSPSWLNLEFLLADGVEVAAQKAVSGVRFQAVVDCIHGGVVQVNPPDTPCFGPCRPRVCRP